MSGPHFDVDEIASRLDGSGVGELSDIRAHAAACSVCATRMRRAVALAEALGNSANASAGAMPQSLRDAARRVFATPRDTELQDALEARDLRAIRTHVRAKGSTLPIVRRLTKGSVDNFDTDPIFALELARLALDGERDPGEGSELEESLVRAAALKAAANALLTLSRYPEALAELDRADDVLRPFAGAGFDRAQLLYVRASVLRELDRLDEAEALLHECLGLFAEYGDTMRVRNCQVVLGAVAFSRKDFAAAYRTYETLLTQAPTDAAASDRARLHNNLGQCAVELGRHDLAATHLENAAGLFEQLGMQTEVARARWGVARLLSGSGRANESLSHFDRARQLFRELRMIEEASLAGLNEVEALLTIGDRTRAADLARHIVSDLEQAVQNPRAAAAVETLRTRILEDDIAPDIAPVYALIDSLATSKRAIN